MEVRTVFITDGFKNASILLSQSQEGGLGKLSDSWGSCTPITDLDDARFMWYNLVDIIFGALYVQENSDFYIPYVCNYVEKSLESGSTPAAAFKQFLHNVVCYNHCTPGGNAGAYDEFINGIKAVDMDINGTRWDRQW